MSKRFLLVMLVVVLGLFAAILTGWITGFYADALKPYKWWVVAGLGAVAVLLIWATYLQGKETTADQKVSITQETYGKKGKIKNSPIAAPADTNTEITQVADDGKIIDSEIKIS